MKYPVNLSLPGAGIIAVVGRSYEPPLSDALIQQWLYELYAQYLAQPDYLLVTEKTRYELARILAEDYYSHAWMRFSIADMRDCYPNKMGGPPLQVVVFPDLPEQTLFLASMLQVVDVQKVPATPPRVKQPGGAVDYAVHQTTYTLDRWPVKEEGEEAK